MLLDIVFLNNIIPIPACGMTYLNNNRCVQKSHIVTLTVGL